MLAKLNENDYLRCVRALRAGGFVCVLPHVIDPAWGGHAQLLAGFPITVSFTGLSREVEQDCQFAVTSCYVFDPSTYVEDEERRSMTYLCQAPCAYRVELVYRKRESRWEGQKLQDAQVLVNASGPELQQFIIHLTMLGVEPGEPVRKLQTIEGSSCAGIYVFTPDLG